MIDLLACAVAGVDMGPVAGTVPDDTFDQALAVVQIAPAVLALALVLTKRKGWLSRAVPRLFTVSLAAFAVTVATGYGLTIPLLVALGLDGLVVIADQRKSSAIFYAALLGAAVVMRVSGSNLGQVPLPVLGAGFALAYAYAMASMVRPWRRAGFRPEPVAIRFLASYAEH